MRNEEAKNLLINGGQVEYAGGVYKITAIVYRYSGGKLIISAELLDRGGNSLIYAKISDVNKIKG